MENSTEQQYRRVVKKGLMGSKRAAQDRVTPKYPFRGEKKTAQEIADVLGLSVTTVRRKLKAGQSLDN